jgi:hypothetical protein
MSLVHRTAVLLHHIFLPETEKERKVHSLYHAPLAFKTMQLYGSASSLVILTVPYCLTLKIQPYFVVRVIRRRRGNTFRNYDRKLQAFPKARQRPTQAAAAPSGDCELG